VAMTEGGPSHLFLTTDQVEARAKHILELYSFHTIADQTRLLHGALVLLIANLPPELRRDICLPLIRSFKRLAE